MKTMKMFGLVAAAVVAAMAFIGSSTAAAAQHEGIGVCKKNEPILCAAGNLITVPPGGSIDVLTEAKEPILKGTLTEKCSTSQLTFKTSEEDKNPVVGQIKNLTFTGGCTPCSTVTVLKLPYEAKLSMANVGASEDYVLTSSVGEELENCSFGQICKFEGTVTLLGINTVGGIEFRAEEELLKQTGGSALFCGTTGKWTASYIVTAIDLLDSTGNLIAKHTGPAWLTLLEKK